MFATFCYCTNQFEIRACAHGLIASKYMSTCKYCIIMSHLSKLDIISLTSMSRSRKTIGDLNFHDRNDGFVSSWLAHDRTNLCLKQWIGVSYCSCLTWSGGLGSHSLYSDSWLRFLLNGWVEWSKRVHTCQVEVVICGGVYGCVWWWHGVSMSCVSWIGAPKLPPFHSQSVWHVMAPAGPLTFWSSLTSFHGLCKVPDKEKIVQTFLEVARFEPGWK